MLSNDESFPNSYLPVWTGAAACLSETLKYFGKGLIPIRQSKMYNPFKKRTYEL